MKYSIVLAIAAFALAPLQSQAWHNEGHMTVAAIAWDQMTPQARAKAAAILRSAPANSGIAHMRPTTGSQEDRDRQQFIKVATWPDTISQHRDWHYTDYFWEQQTPGGPARVRDDVAPHGNLVPKLGAIERSLSGHGPSPSGNQAMDLAFFIHLMGDIAQPLHCSGRVAPENPLPEGDRGGNLFHLGGSQNLHQFWDHVIEREFGEHADIGQVAHTLEAGGRPMMLGLHGYESWAKTSRKIAMQRAYPATLVRGQAPPPPYRTLVKQICSKTIALGGYRLGATLNEILAH